MKVFQIKTPECDKALLYRDDNQIIAEFFEWLQSKGYVICEYLGENWYPTPIHHSLEQLLAQYRGINLAKMEKEKRAILDAVRND